MASRRHEGRPADIGASYFTVSDPAFEQVVRGWEQAGLARPWTDTFGTATPAGRGETTTGPVRWGTPGGIRSLVEALAVDLPVRSATEVERVATVDGLPSVDGRPASAVVLAMPDPQAARLVDAEVHPEAASGLTATYDAVLALTAVYPERCWEDLPDGLFVNDDPTLAWIADDGRRRCDGAPVLVAHSTDAHARPHLAAPQEGGPAMLEALHARPRAHRGAPLDLRQAGGRTARAVPADRLRCRGLRRLLVREAAGGGRLAVGHRAGTRPGRAAGLSSRHPRGLVRGGGVRSTATGAA